MKKTCLSLTLSLVFVLSLLFSNLAFGATSSVYKDGIYKAEAGAYDKFGGYKATVSITIKGGKITAATYEAFTKDGKAKSKDVTYEANMVKAVKVGPKEYLAKFPKSLVKVQTVDKVDTITGATSSRAEFIKFTNAALENAKKGIKTTAVVN
jgi:major membrane immunogen (membrane-anchored lipoprotein)